LIEIFVCAVQVWVTKQIGVIGFIRDSQLHDKEFERCDADEDYLVQETSDTTGEDGSEHVENEDTMNIIRTRIADGLVSAREG
jgi:hypothetical protein